jgi:transcriptional regulator with XRE-family HTH domain
MSFSENFREALDCSGIQQKQLANETNINQRSIEKYLQKDGSIPSAEKAVKIAQVLGVTVEYLVTGKNLSDKNSASIDHEIRQLIKSIKTLPKDKQRIAIKSILSHLAETV